jgi:hypothetical protein
VLLSQSGGVLIAFSFCARSCRNKESPSRGIQKKKMKRAVFGENSTPFIYKQGE